MYKKKKKKLTKVYDKVVCNTKKFRTLYTIVMYGRTFCNDNDDVATYLICKNFSFYFSVF